MRNNTVQRTLRIGLALLGGLAALSSVSDARAQVAGAAARPLPNVLLLVDNSGSMERKPNNQLPNCVRGSTTSEVNRWGMLLQALTGNFQPYFSCEAVSRIKATNPAFAARYGINGVDPYDTDYFLPYNQPMTGSTAADACVTAPWKLPGAAAGSGVGANKVGASGNATDFPDTSLANYKFSALGNGLPDTLVAANQCTFDQNNDGQLDVSKAYARFALMTFDSVNEKETGLTGTYPSQSIDTANPFKGQWSYLRNTGNPYVATTSNTSALGIGAQGMPGTTPACLPSFMEVGARNSGAPPWEGRLIPFADEDATLYDLDAQNSLIQQTLLATRPYGATPIDGLFDDARDFLLNDAQGPKADKYKCRDKYIVLLTDGAPNLNLRPTCTAANGVCPYPKQAFEIADALYNQPDASKVTTFVIGFSVNGVAGAANNDGFPTTPAGINSCKTWFDNAAGSLTDEKLKAKAMNDACTAANPAAGSTAEACCQLNKIAYMGSESGAYFAESQADIVLAFGRIMANIIHSASTKTIPAFSPAVQFSAGAFARDATASTKATSAQFIASFIPSSQTPWSGELDRTRNLCVASVPTPQAPARAQGDYQSENVAKQSNQKARLFLSVLADKPITDTIDSSATIRPFVGTGDGIGNPHTSANTTYSGKEVAMSNYNLHFDADWKNALNITNKTCRQGRAVRRGKLTAARGTDVIPALDDATNGAQQCTDVVWGFATAYPDPLKVAPSSTYDFNVRCTGATTDSGVCSITGDTCVPSAPTACTTGETCLPACAAMGAVFHSSPTVIGPPTSLLREEGFRNYQAKFVNRRTVMYSATTDGLLHAFDAMKQAGPESYHELWAFAPPAVLPKLASNYPGGNQILLDGAPVVRETVWDRTTAQISDPKKWHTTLVAGLGTLGGYYAMNVTDADCTDGSGTDDCRTKYEAPGQGQPKDVGLPDSSGAEGTQKRGPHFLWQLTDVHSETTETAKIGRDSNLGTPSKTPMAQLFGKNTGTPAIGSVQIKTTSTDPEHQIGIAILPGGYDDPPIAGQNCPRATKPTDVRIDDTVNGKYRANVRRWAKGGCTSPVPGRNVSIVRLDTGEVIRVFGRQQDVPKRLHDKLAGSGGVIETLLDSPMIGTPVIYPDQVGVPMQSIFIGDADGGLWKIDVRSTNPKDWKAYFFADLIGNATLATDASQSQPVQVAPVLSTDDQGNVIINAATGDQESVVASDTLENFVYSIRDSRDSTGKQFASVLWYKRFAAAERITGPMTVFDKTLYFASYKPIRPTGTTSASCNGPGNAYLWGMHYTDVKGAVSAGNGGVDRWCPSGNIDNTVGGSGLCTATLVANEASGNDIIPGVALTASQACLGSDIVDEYGNTMFGSMTQSTYSLSFGISRPNSEGSNKAQAARKNVQRPFPRMATQINSWSLVLE